MRVGVRFAMLREPYLPPTLRDTPGHWRRLMVPTMVENLQSVRHHSTSETTGVSEGPRKQ